MTAHMAMLNRERVRRWRARNPNLMRQRAKDWRTKNPERIKEIENKAAAKKYARYKKRINARNIVWKQNNPDKCRAYRENYRARKMQASGCYTAEDVAALLKKQDFICAAPFCDTNVTQDGHVDHIKALSRGGTNWPDNLQILCPPCNQGKGAKDYEDWIEEKRRAA